MSLALLLPPSDGAFGGGADPSVADGLRLILKQAASRADDLLKLRHYVRRQVTEKACRGEVPVDVDDHRTWSIRPCGQWLAASEGDAVARLRALGLEVTRLEAPAEVLGDRYVASLDANDMHNGQVRLMDALIDKPTDSFYLPLDQPLANMAITALEPNHDGAYPAQGIITDFHQLARLRRPLALAHDELAFPLQVQAP